jgi:hypothetical protein
MKQKTLILAVGAAALTYLALTRKKEESANSLIVNDDNSVHVTQTSPSEPGREEELVEQPNLLNVRTPFTTVAGVYGAEIADPITLVAGQTYTFTYMGQLSQTSVDEGLRLWASPEFTGMNKEGVDIWYYPADIVPLDERDINTTTPTIVSFTFTAEYTGVYYIRCWYNIINAERWEDNAVYPYKGGDVIEWVKLEKGSQFTGYTPENEKKNSITQPFDGGLKDIYKTNELYRGDKNKDYDSFYDYSTDPTMTVALLNSLAITGLPNAYMRARIIPQWVGVSEEEMWTNIKAKFFVDKIFESWWAAFNFNMVGRGLGMFAGIELFNPTDYPISLDSFEFKGYSLNDRELIFLNRNNQIWSDNDHALNDNYPHWSSFWNKNYEFMLNKIFDVQKYPVCYHNVAPVSDNKRNFYYNILPRSSVMFFTMIPGWFVDRVQFDYNQYTVVNSKKYYPDKGSATYELTYDVNPFKDSSALRLWLELKGYKDTESCVIYCSLREGAAPKVYDQFSWKTQHIDGGLAANLNAIPTVLQEQLNERYNYSSGVWEGHEAEQARFEAVKNMPPEEFLNFKFI